MIATIEYTNEKRVTPRSGPFFLFDRVDGLFELRGLAGGFEDAAEQIASDVDGLLAAGDEAHGQVHEGVIPAAYDHFGAACHRRVNRALGQLEAVASNRLAQTNQGVNTKPHLETPKSLNK